MIKITWDDAGSFQYEGETWNDLEEVKKAYGEANFLQESVGYLVFKNNKDYIIAQSLDTQEDCHNKYANCQ